MAITISGENNNDKILASDGVIDQISGINIVGLITASHINVGSNIQLGNAGIVTATTFVGNLTGNVNSTSPLLLQTGGSERFRITGNNELGIAGANYGSSGQVLTSGGSGSAVTWSAIPSQANITNNADNRVITGGSGVNLNGESNLTFDGNTLALDSSTGTINVSRNSRTLTLEGNYGNEGHPAIKTSSGHDLRIFTSGNNERLRIKSDGVFQFNGTNSADNTNKLVYITSPSYDTDEEPFCLIHSGTYNNQNLIYLGGGMPGSYNACTLMKFYTTPSVNTLTGTERLCIESWGGIQNNQGAIYGGGVANEPKVHFNGAAPSNDPARGQFVVSDSAAYDASPIARISLATRYNSAGGYTYMGGIEGGKENSTDGQYGGFVRIMTRPHGNTNQERLRILSNGNISVGSNGAAAEKFQVNGGSIAIVGGAGYKIDTHPLLTYASFSDISGGSYAARLGSTGTSTIRSTQIYGGGGHIATFDGVNKRLGINLTVPTAKLHVSAAYNETGTTITGGALGYNDVLQCNTANGHRRFTVAGDGEIYGPSAGRKNWLDNGSFDCIGGRRANTSMDYGNHHAYGWVTDRFMSRNSVQWSRSTNVPTGKGFSYSTQTNNSSGSLMQAVELPDYGDMGVFTPGSYWCVSAWSTTTIINSASAFSYDLGSTKTDVPLVDNTTNNYASTGETASGTSTGTFTRYYKVYGPMPSSIISGATALYFTWFLQNAGYATGFQLERVPTSTSKPTPYEHVHPAVTTARCRRYCWQNVNSRLHNGYKRHDSYIHWQERFPVPPTHMPSGSNQGATPYGITLHDGGMLTNFQSILQNPGVNSVSISEFDYRSGRFLIVGSTSWSSTHTTAPSWESQEYEISHGFF